MRIPERFEDRVRLDPLFAAEGLDLHTAALALTRIERCAQRVEKALSEGSSLYRALFRAFKIARFWVPTSFLRAMLESEKLRRAYLERPNEAAGAALLRAWKSAQHSLVADLRKYRILHSILYRLPDNSPRDAVMADIAGNTTVPEDIFQTLGLLAENAEALRREIEAITAGDMTSRQHPVAMLPRFEKSNPELEKFARFDEAAALVGHTILEKHGPILHTTTAFDGVPTEHTFFAYVARDNTGVPRLHISLADRQYVASLSDEYDKAAAALYESLRERGVRYWYQPATYFFYTLRDHRYWADIATAIDLQRRPLNADLVRTQRSSLLDLILMTYSRYLYFFAGLTRVRNTLAPQMQLSLFRTLAFSSAPSITYLTYNASVWRLPQEPNFLGSGRLEKNEVPYKELSDIRPHLTEDELAGIMRGPLTRDEVWKREGYL